MEKGVTDSQEKAKEFIRNNNKIRAKYAIEAKMIYEKQIESILNHDAVISKAIR